MSEQTNTSVEYIALWSGGYGGGSWSRDKDQEKAIRRCMRIAFADWRHLFKLAGVETKVNLYRLTNCNEVTIGSDGISCDEDGARIETLPLVTRTFPKGSR